MSKYNHDEAVHNLKNPNIIVPEIVRILKPKSVVDIGCGLGTFLNAFKRFGVADVLGVDGAWVNKELLYKYISPEEFLAHDLEKEIKLYKKFDLVISLEVAEHLKKDSAEIFVQNLVNSGNLILFSAAIPNQGGQNHINEQWLTYWEAKFAKHDYVLHDVIRPIFWDNPEVFWWYSQNIVLVTPKDFVLNFPGESVPMRNIVHYELFQFKARQLEEIIGGKESSTFYMKLLVVSIYRFFVQKIKSLLRRFKKH